MKCDRCEKDKCNKCFDCVNRNSSMVDRDSPCFTCTFDVNVCNYKKAQPNVEQ